MLCARFRARFRSAPATAARRFRRSEAGHSTNRSSGSITALRLISSSPISICLRRSALLEMSIVSRRARYSSYEIRMATGRPSRAKSVRLPLTSHSPTSCRTSGGRSRSSSRFSIAEQALQIRVKLAGKRRMPQGVINSRFEIADLLAGIVTFSLEDVTIEITALHKLTKSVGELNLSSGAASGLFENWKDLRRQNVAADDRVSRRRIRLRLLNHVRDAIPPPAGALSANDSVP